MYNHTISLYNGWIPFSDFSSFDDYVKVERKAISKEYKVGKLSIDDFNIIEGYEKECFVQMLKLFIKENGIEEIVLETDIKESTFKHYITTNSNFYTKWKYEIQQRFPIKEIRKANSESDAVVSIILTGNKEDIGFLSDFPCESGITLNNGDKYMMYLCFERPSQISYLCKEDYVKDEYIQILQYYKEKLIEKIDRYQTSEIIYTIEVEDIE